MPQESQRSAGGTCATIAPGINRKRMEPVQLTEFSYLIGVLDAIVLPLITLVVLTLAKFCQGEAGRRAERQFLAMLVVMTVITLRTVITLDDSWLLHTSTLATMIVASLVVPNQQASVAV